MQQTFIFTLKSTAVWQKVDALKQFEVTKKMNSFQERLNLTPELVGSDVSSDFPALLIRMSTWAYEWAL